MGRVPAGRRVRVAAGAAICALLFVVVFGIATTWHSVISLPSDYQRLRARGVEASAQLVTCARGIGGGRGVGCRLRLAFRGETREFDYPEDSAQFHGLRPGAAVPVLVDPASRTTAYTVHDVRSGTNAGWSVPAFFGLGLATLGLAAIAWLGRFWLRQAPMVTESDKDRA